MISQFIRLLTIIPVVLYLASCSSSSSSSSASTSVTFSATPSPASAAVMMAGPKTIADNGAGFSITLNKAYLVISSATVETSCSASFMALLDKVVDVIIPSANAHTTTTPTSTGTPYVINLLAMDNVGVSIGSISPPVGDYCGLTLDMLAADADTSNLPTDVDMIGKTVYLEGSFSHAAAGNTFTISAGATLLQRNILLSSLLMISQSNLNGSVDVGVNYDVIFNNIDMDALALETSQTDPESNQVLVNMTGAIHQL